MDEKFNKKEALLETLENEETDHIESDFLKKESLGLADQKTRPENVLRDSVEETFLFWKFEENQGYTVFRLAQEN